MPAVANVYLKNLEHNLSYLSSFSPKSKLMPVLKANAYGHGVDEWANGDLGINDAAELSKLIDTYVRTIEATQFEQRLRALEKSVS